MDGEIHEYLKNEMNKGKKLEKLRDNLKAKVEQGRLDLEHSLMKEVGTATEMLSGVPDAQILT